jgi:hypothetical protein
MLLSCTELIIRTPSDYYLFSKLKKDLWGKKFDEEEEVKTAVREHFTCKNPEYFLKGTELLVHRCEKCVDIKGDCIEKQQSCFIFVTLKSWSGRKLLDPTTYLSQLLLPAAIVEKLELV